MKKKRGSGSGNKDDHISKWRYFKVLHFLMPTFDNSAKRKSNLQVSYDRL